MTARETPRELVEPCPWCTAPARLIEERGHAINRCWIQCDGCDAQGPLGRAGRGDEAIEAWNRIASAVARVKAEAEERHAKAVAMCDRLRARVEELEKSQSEWHRIATTLEFERDEAERSLLAVRDALRTVLGDYGNFTCPECGRGEIHKTGCSIFATLTATGPQAAEVERRLRVEGARWALQAAVATDFIGGLDAERVVAARTHEKESRNG